MEPKGEKSLIRFVENIAIGMIKELCEESKLDPKVYEVKLLITHKEQNHKPVDFALF